MGEAEFAEREIKKEHAMRKKNLIDLTVTPIQLIRFRPKIFEEDIKN
jgi:hypothetical protein